MKLQLVSAMSVATAILAATPAMAQQVSGTPSPDQPDVKAERVVVKLADSPREVRGRLLHLDSQTLSIHTDHRRVDLPLGRVRQIDVVKRDSLVNGAAFGALYLGACAKWWCGQGLDSSSGPSALDVVLGVGMGALVGAGIDALFNKRTTIFTAGPAPGSHGAALSFRIRF